MLALWLAQHACECVCVLLFEGTYADKVNVSGPPLVATVSRHRPSSHQSLCTFTITFVRRVAPV